MENILYLSKDIAYKSINLFVLIFILKKVRDIAINIKVRTFLSIKRNYLMEKILEFVDKNIFYFGVVVLFVLHRELNVIIEIEKSQSLVLLISILTLYGIFLSFLQFLIGFGPENKNNNHWGESKIAYLLNLSREYKFLNSLMFRYLILYVTCYTLFRITYIGNIEMETQELLYDIYLVSITTIAIEYVLLFIRSMKIKRELMNIQRDRDIHINFKIEEKIEEEFTERLFKLFNGENNYFIEIFRRRLKNVDEAERAKMSKQLLLNSYIEWELSEMRKQKNLKSITKKKIGIKNKTYSSKIFIENEKLWGSDIFDLAKSSFGEMNNIYNRQKKLMLNQLLVDFDCDESSILSYIERRYLSKRMKINKNCIYYIPEKLWSKINSYEDIKSIVIRLEENEFVEYFYDEDRDFLNNDLYKNLNNQIIYEYRSFIRDVLRKIKEKKLYEDEKFNLSELFKFYNGKKNYKNQYIDSKELAINNSEMRDFIKKKEIIGYIRELGVAEGNKKYISKIMKEMDLKWCLAYVFYRMVHPRGILWEKEMEFLKDIFEETLRGRENYSKGEIDFVTEEIKNTNISHRIGRDFTNWILLSLRGEIEGKTIEICMEEKNFSYIKYLKIREVTNTKTSNFLDHSVYEDICFKGLSKNQRREYLYIIDNMIRDINFIKNENLFYHLYNMIGEFMCEEMFSDLLSKESFEIFVIGCEFMSIVQIYRSILNKKAEEKLIKNDIFDYLALRLDNNLEFKMLKNRNLKKLFLDGIEDSLNSKNMVVEEYITSLCQRSSLYRKNISVHKKEIISKRLTILMNKRYGLN